MPHCGRQAHLEAVSILDARQASPPWVSVFSMMWSGIYPVTLTPIGSPSDFRCGRVFSSFESKHGLIINAVGILLFNHNDKLISTYL